MISEPGKTSNWLFEISSDKAFGFVFHAKMSSAHIFSSFGTKLYMSELGKTSNCLLIKELTEVGVKLWTELEPNRGSRIGLVWSVGLLAWTRFSISVKPARSGPCAPLVVVGFKCRGERRKPINYHRVLRCMVRNRGGNSERWAAVMANLIMGETRGGKM